nr:hypothetical protein [uncultured Dyadobacter sp.]
MDKYVRSDFVARVTVVKNFPNQGSSFFYESNIVIKQLFKGNNVKSILIEGSSDGKKRSSCDIYFKEGTEMLVYANLDSAGKYTFNSCSGYRVLNHSKFAGEGRELEMLDFLDRNKIRTTDKTFYGANLYDKLKTLRDINTTKTFGIYEITFTKDLRIDTIRTVTGFSPELDNQLISILSEARWVSDRILIDGLKNTVPPGSKLLFGFYYYPAQGNDARFISQWDL